MPSIGSAAEGKHSKNKLPPPGHPHRETPSPQCFGLTDLFISGCGYLTDVSAADTTCLYGPIRAVDRGGNVAVLVSMAEQLALIQGQETDYSVTLNYLQCPHQEL